MDFFVITRITGDYKYKTFINMNKGTAKIRFPMSVTVLMDTYKTNPNLLTSLNASTEPGQTLMAHDLHGVYQAPPVDLLIFPTSLSSSQRRTIHMKALEHGLFHISIDLEDGSRQLIVGRDEELIESYHSRECPDGLSLYSTHDMKWYDRSVIKPNKKPIHLAPGKVICRIQYSFAKLINLYSIF